MADVNQQAQELADLMSRVNREMELYGRMHQSTADEVQDAAMKSKHGITNFTKGTTAAADALTSVAKAGVEGAKAMYEGKKGAAAFNSSIDELSNAAKLAGAALTLLIPGGPLIKGLIAGLTAVTAATAEYIKAANVMADKIYDGYSKLAKAGGAASDGMTGVYQGAKKLGLSMNELDSYVGLIADNAGDLTLFAGSVADGRKKFEDMGAAMEPYRKSLMAAGYTQQEINDASMQYLRLQSRIGQSQNLTTKQLAEGANKYLKEQDALTQLTGMSRKEQEQALEAARSQQRFRAKLEEMRNSGDAKQIAAADEMEVTYKMLYKRSKEAATGYGDLATGMMGTDAAMKLYQSTQGEALNILDKQKAGQLKGIEAFDQTGKAVGRVTKEMNYLYQMGVGEETMLKISEGAELGLATQKDNAAEAEKIREDMKKQGRDGGKAADGITDQYAENIKKQQALNKKMEDAVFVGIDKALSVTEKLGNVTNVLADQFTMLSKALNKVLGFFGLGVKEPAKEQPKTAQETKAAAATSKERDVAKPLQERADLLAKQLEADEKSLKDAKRAGKYGEELKPLEEKIAKNKEEYAKASQSLLDQEKKIADAAREERKVRQQQRLDQGELARLETMNVSEVERLAKLNEERANLAAKGVSTAKVEQKIADTKASIDTRSGQISTLKGKLAPVAGGGAVPAGGGGAAGGGAAPTTAPTRSSTPPPPSAGAPDGQPGQPTPAGQAQGGGKGSLKIGPNADMSGLNNEMISRLQKFAESTGKSVDVNSAYRSDQKQAELWVRGHILNEPGVHMPAAPKDDQEITYQGKTYNVKGSGKGSLHGVGNAVDISVAGMGKSKGPMDELLANAGLFRPFIAKDHPHVQMLAEGGIVQPTPGGTPAVIGEGGTAEAVMPLKGNRIPVDFPDEIKKYFQFQSQVDNLKFLKGDTGKDTYQDVDSVVAASQAKMFAKLSDMKTELMAKGFDREMLENYGEEDKKSGPKTEADVVDLQSRYNDDVVAESIKENVAQTKTLIDMISELVREQRNANDISTKILQVTSN